MATAPSRPASRPTGVLDAAGLGVGSVLAAIAAVRGGKAVHPHGVVHDACLRLDGPGPAPDCAAFTAGAEHRAIVRFSRSVGLPRPLPDLLGASLRLVDAYGRGRHQDLLMVTSIDRPILHHLFVPATDVQQRVYTTALPYAAGGLRFLVGLVPDPASPRPPGADEFDRLGRAAATGALAFGLAVAPIGGRFRRIGSLRVGERLPAALDALRFHPRNCGRGLEPAGALNGMRDRAYVLSQRAWARRDGGAAAQLRADRALRALGAEQAARR